MTGVTRSMEADTTLAAARVERRRRSLPNGWWGMALLVATEAALFGSLLSTYWYLRFNSVAWPPPGVTRPSVALPLVLTGALVATTAPMLAAVGGARRGRVRAVWLLLLVAVLVQGSYLGIQVHLFADEMAKFSPRETAYGSMYFTLLAVHHAHVGAGILLNLWLLGRLLGGLTNQRMIAVRVVSLYWAFVNAVAVLVVLTQLSPSL